MISAYARWVGRWEHRLATRDTDRVVRPFEWGLDWLGLAGESDPAAAVRKYVARALADSRAFFSYSTPSDYCLDQTHLTFTSPVVSPYPENNLVRAEFFPCSRDRGRAVLVLPQWNADEGGHLGLCRLLNVFGLTALRMSLAYHDRRKPPCIQRADYHVSSNVGRTLHAGRQSVIDARSCMDWLEQRGYTRLGILGTSLGSCIAFITAVHDARVRAAVLNHISTYFSDVVWTGISTGHMHQSFAAAITQDDLRDFWSIRTFSFGNPNPYAMCSASWVPAPTPNSNLPLEITSSVAAVLASNAGLWWAMQETMVPSRILLVAEARAARVV